MASNHRGQISSNLLVWLVILLFCLLGGVLGAWLLAKQNPLTPLVNEINLGDGLNGQARVLIRDPRKVVVNQDLKVQDIVLSARESSLYIFRNQVVDKTEKGIDVTKAYDLSSPDLFGLSLTADGWILILTPDKFSAKSLVSDYQAVTQDKKIYNIDKTVDYPGGGFALAHLSGANNLVVKNLLGASDSQVGQTVLAVNASGDAWLSYVSSWRPGSNLYRSSDELNWRLELMEEIPAAFKNSWLFAMNGDLLAFIDARGVAKPALNFRSPVYSYFKQQSFSRPYLGVNYWDLSRLVKNTGSGKENNLNISGALLGGDNGRLSTAKGSPAEKAGLAAGDIIVAVSGVELNEFNDLATIIQGYKVGDEVTLKFWRQGEIKEVDVVLGEKK